MTKRSPSPDSRSPAGPSDRMVLERAYAMGPDEAETWAYFTQLARKAGPHPNRSEQTAVMRHLKRRSLVPLEGTVDLPPHILGRVSEQGTESSVIHSFDLENLVEFPEIYPCLLSDSPGGNKHSIRVFHAFVDTSCDYRYLRRFIVSDPELARKTINVLREVIKEDPACSMSHRLLLDWYDSQGMRAEAAEEARRFRAATTSSYDAATLDLAMVLSLQGRTEDALKALEPEGKRGYSKDFAKRIPYLQDYFRARAIRTPEDAALLDEDLRDFFHTLIEWMKEFMPGAFEESVAQYGSLPGSFFPTAGDTRVPLDFKSRSILLYIAFAFRSKSRPDTPAEVFGTFAGGAYSVVRSLDTAIHGSRRGLFRVVRRVGESEGRTLVEAYDPFTGQSLKVFLPGPPDAPPITEGTVFRAQLVPWQNLWLPRGPIECVSSTDLPEPKTVPFRVWFVDIHSPHGGDWICLAEDVESGLLTGGDVSPYPNAGLVVETLQKAHRERGYLPDILITRAGFPFTDPTGRTAASWHEYRVGSSLQHGISPPADLRAVSLLQPWIETWGVRHIADTEALEEEMAPRWKSLAEFLKRGKVPSSSDPPTQEASPGFDLRTGHRR